MRDTHILSLGTDPFTRTTLVRRSADDGPGSNCAECGNRNGYGKLWEYGTEHGNRVSWHKGLFCSISCHHSYHGTGR